MPREPPRTINREPRVHHPGLRGEARTPTLRAPSRRYVVEAILVLGLGVGLLSCQSLGKPSELPEEQALAVKKVEEEVILAVWAEPARLPEGGGQAQILVRVRRRGGKPFPEVEVRLRTSAGSLYSGGRVLVTDQRGVTRDRLTTRKTATITLNAGGTRYRFRVPVGEDSE